MISVISTPPLAALSLTSVSSTADREGVIDNNVVLVFLWREIVLVPALSAWPSGSSRCTTGRLFVL